MKYFLFCFISITFSCSSKNETKLIIAAKNKTIDSLKVELIDCKLQAEIMAEVLEEDRIKSEEK